MKLKLSLNKDHLIILLIAIVAGVLILQSMQINTVSSMIERKIESPQGSLARTLPFGLIGGTLPPLGGCNLG